MSQRLVYHDPDGDWWFSTAAGDDDPDLAIFCLACVLHSDRELVAVCDLPPDWIAWRDDGGPWTREPRPKDWGSWDEDATASDP